MCMYTSHICLYCFIFTCMCDSMAGMQGLAGASARIPNLHATQGKRMCHPLIPLTLIRIPKMFSWLVATGIARKIRRVTAAWQQKCAATYGCAHNLHAP